MWEELNSDVNEDAEKFLISQQRLEESYARCTGADLHREVDRPNVSLTGEALQRLLAGHASLIAYTHLLFADTHRFFPDPRQVLLLTDVNACVIGLYSPSKILEAASSRCGLCVGVSLDESSCGTNAMTLALHHRDVAVLQGQQHFCRLFHDWCTVAAPVLSLQGRPIACVGIGYPYNSPLAEKPALIRFLAQELGHFSDADKPCPSAARENGDSTEKDGNGSGIALTSRQRQVLLSFAKGLSYKQIARKLGITSTKTVEEHLDAVRKKLGVDCRRECIQRATELGLLTGNSNHVPSH